MAEVAGVGPLAVIRGAAREIGRHVPILAWLPTYPRPWLRLDLIAGVTSWAVMVPTALAYAGLAGVPPELGLTTAFAALAAYAVFGTSRHLKVTVSSTMAIMSASVVGDLAGGDPATFIALSAALALIVGLILIGAGIVRLGFISDFLTKSVITGFIFGLALTIIVGQVPKLLGVKSVSGSVPEQLRQIVDQVPDANPYTLAVGIGSLALILVLRRISRRIPGALIALALGILAVPVFNLQLHGVSVVGEIATGLPHAGIPSVSLSTLPFLLVGAAGIVFLAVGESVGAGRAFAARHDYEIDADQELIALGAANLGSGIFGGFVTDASLSQTAAGEAAGTRSQLSALVTSILIVATMVVLAPVFQNLPNAVLGAIVIAASLSLIDVREMRRYWTWRRTDFTTAVAALVGVVLTTVLVGLLVAVLLSLMFLLYRASRPYVAELGRLPGEPVTFGDLTRHPNAERVPGFMIVRLDAPLYFFNANVARAEILRLVDVRPTPPRFVVIDLAATADLDVTSADVLLDLLAKLRDRSISVLLTHAKGGVRDRLARTGLLDLIGETHLYRSISAAVAAAETAGAGELPDPVSATDETTPDAGAEPAPAAEPA